MRTCAIARCVGTLAVAAARLAPVLLPGRGRSAGGFVDRSGAGPGNSPQDAAAPKQ